VETRTTLINGAIPKSQTSRGKNYPVPGKWIFWTNKSFYSSSIIVHFLGEEGDITLIYPTVPACGSNGCYTINIGDLVLEKPSAPISYSYYAVDSASPVDMHKWSGDIIITPDNWEHCNSTSLTW
jgi:hypothetical protein